MQTGHSALRQAAACDAAGDHDEAVNVLARATGAGDLAAMTALGKRLLVGDRAPYLPKEGAGMVLEAAYKGFPEAIALTAVFQCTGIFQPQNWHAALDTLTLAARRGWAPAREQLLLLNGHSLEDAGARLDAGDDAHWRALGRAVDLDSWLRPAAGTTLNESPLIRSFSGFLPPAVCRLLIRQSRNRLKPALVYDPQGRRDVRSRTRTNSIAQFTLVENEMIHFLLQAKMSAACGQPMVHMEATAILNYQPGEQITDHFDFVAPDLPDYAAEIASNGQRVITFLIYLNDDYQGGQTAFTELGIEHKGRLGEGLYFVNALPDGAPDLRTRHAGRPPLDGEKWIVSQFVRNRPVKYVLA